jgi:hypothetical protein
VIGIYDRRITICRKKAFSSYVIGDSMKVTQLNPVYPSAFSFTRESKPLFRNSISEGCGGPHLSGRIGITQTAG